MEPLLLFIVIACLGSALLTAYLCLKPKPKLPPGLRGVPVIGNLGWLEKSWLEVEAALISLRSKFGPIVSLPMDSLLLLFVFIMDRDLAHQALVQKSAIFADRPKVTPTTSQLSISSAPYGPTWSTLRRNLTSRILHPSRLKEYSYARKWVLDILLPSLGSTGDSAVKVVDHFRFAMFSLTFHMCFGGRHEECKIREVEAIQRQLLVSSSRSHILNVWPRLTRILLRKRWKQFFSLKKKQEGILVPLIRARKDIVKDDTEKSIICYVDTLLNLEVQEDVNRRKRKLTEEEMVSVCSEFLSAGTDTTFTALQWIMANLVKNPDIQAKLFYEIRGVIGAEAKHVGEDLLKMPYLKAVVLEGLRRHPPSHFAMPHSVTEDVELGGYVVPKNAVIIFTIAEMGWDPKVWEDPMAFNPEGFMPAEGSEGVVEFDLTGSQHIKMMPFGVGRRICPALSVAILHLEYFVANLVWKFKWAVAEGHEVDLSEKQEFTVVMKHPLHACISPRHPS